MTRLTTIGETVAGAAGSMALNTTCAVIAIGAPRKAAKGAKSRAASSSRLAATTGSSRWLSARARPWPGMCLTTGRTPPGEQALAERAAERGDALGRTREGARADHRMGSASATSSTGAQSTVIPTSRRSWAMSRAASQAARCGSAAASKRAAAG